MAFCIGLREREVHLSAIGYPQTIAATQWASHFLWTSLCAPFVRASVRLLRQETRGGVMTEPKKSAELIALEKEFREAINLNDHLSALDIFDEIAEAGEVTSTHLLWKGKCLMALRQKQDARETWIRAYGLDSESVEIQKALHEFFPGWKKTIATPRPKPVVAKAPVVKPEPVRQAHVTSASASPSFFAGPGTGLSDINWDYVLADVAKLRADSMTSAVSVEATDGDDEMPEFSLDFINPSK